MDAQTLAIFLRGGERLCIVMVAALCIWLGYKLFQSLPAQHGSGGTLTLPSAKLVMSKVGPGVFFALFGGLVLWECRRPRKAGRSRRRQTCASRDSDDRAPHRSRRLRRAHCPAAGGAEAVRGTYSLTYGVRRRSAREAPAGDARAARRGVARHSDRDARRVRSDPAFVLNVASVPAARQVILPLRTAVWLEEYFALMAYLERRKCQDRLTIALLYDAKLATGGRDGVRPPGPGGVRPG